MRRAQACFVAVMLLIAMGLWAQESQPAPSSNSDTVQLRQEIEQLKKTIAAMEQRLAAAEKNNTQPTPSAESKDVVSATDLQSQVKDLDARVGQAERKSALDRLAWSGDFRVESHSIFGTVPTFYDGMKLQNQMVKTLWLFAPQSQGGLGMAFDPNMLGQMTPAQFAGFLSQQVQQNYSQYQYFSGNLTFPALREAVGQFPPQMQQMLMSYLQQVPGVLTQGYKANNDVLLTNRLRLNLDSQLSDNVSVTARLSMYKVFGDSTGVQMFNGQASTLAIDGTTSTVPGGDMVRVERAFFTWKDIGGSKFYLSIGRRPSTDGPPMNFRDDEPRGGTPSGALINYQFDGLTLGYHVNDKMSLRACYGMGYEAGYGNGQLLQNPADRLKDVHFFGGNLDLYATDRSLVQATIARAWNVTDGFNGEIVLPNNPVTGDPITAPVIMRFTPSVNLGAINLYGVNAQTRIKSFDVFASANFNSLRPNGNVSPFGGLGSDPFETPTNHDGAMVYIGARFNFPQNDGRSKLGFEFNHGSKYWFNFAQAEDDILAPKTSVRGEAYQAYFTHRINQRFIFKADYQRFNYAWSGSGWHVGAPKKLDSTPILGFPSYDVANMLSFGLTARF